MILAVDQGTTGTTCLVVDEELRLRGRGYAELRQRYPGQFTDGQLRTLQRHIAVWRAHTILAFADDWSDEAVDAGQILPQPLRVAVEVNHAAERSA